MYTAGDLNPHYYYYYIRQVNGVKLADKLFYLHIRPSVRLCAPSPVRQKPGLNPGPFAWEANVITITLQKRIV